MSTFAVGTRVIGHEGLEGEIEQIVDREKLIVRFDSGHRALLRQDTLTPDDGVVRVQLTPTSLVKAKSQVRSAGDDLVIPILEEIVHVGVEKFEAGRVRVVKRVESRDETVEQPVTHEHVDVERVPVGRTIPEGEPPPTARQEGDVFVVPVLEEVLVVEKRLVLKEELRLTRRREVTTKQEHVSLRKEHVDVVRDEPTS